MNLSAYVHVGSRCPQRLRAGVGTLGAGVTGGFELPGADAENQTQVLGRSGAPEDALDS